MEAIIKIVNENMEEEIILQYIPKKNTKTPAKYHNETKIKLRQLLDSYR